MRMWWTATGKGTIVQLPAKFNLVFVQMGTFDQSMRVIGPKAKETESFTHIKLGVQFKSANTTVTLLELPLAEVC